MRDTVEACALLIVRMDDVPRRITRVGSLQHLVARSRIVVPAAARRQINRAQLPLAQRIFDSCFKATLLLVIADFQPVFDEHNAGIDDVLFYLRTNLKKMVALLLSTEAHYGFHTSAVVPA